MADSQRKTANLFDKSNGSYNAYVDDVGTWRYVDTAKSVKIPCSANTTYSLSVPENLSVFRIYEISDASAEPPTQAAEIIRSGGIDNYTFTTASTTAAIIFQGSAGSFDEWFNGLMLNTGETPLPYEPYGWLHSLRKLGSATDTITTLPADLYADGTNATVGLVGNMSQSGTPTPDNPIMPEGCGERTANLYNIDAKNTDNGYINGTQLNKDGTTESWSVCEVTEYIELQPSTSYRLSKIGSYNAIAYCIYDANKQYISGQNYSGQSVIAIVMPSNGKYLRFSHHKTQTNTMLNEGSTALPYQPYGYELDIKSANITTPVYLGEVEATRKIKKLVFDGTENWRQSVNGAMYLSPFTGESYKKEVAITSMNSHFAVQSNTTSGTNQVGDNSSCFLAASGSAEYYIGARSYATAADFKTYLQQQYANGTPVCVWYVLATETTGIVNEPLRKIGDYADTVSGITIPTITGKDTFDVLTTLKPSEVELTYTGWHDAAVEEWDGSQWQ